LLLSSLMEDFSIFGIGWQLEVAEKNIKECEQKNLSGLAIQRNRLTHRYLNFRWQAIKMYKDSKDVVLKLIQVVLEREKKKRYRTEEGRI